MLARSFAQRYDVQPGSLASIGAFEAEVCSAQGPLGPLILKVIDPSHRTRDQVRAELDWLRALRRAGVRVARPVRSRAGHWIESTGDPPHLAVAFERAPGRHLPAAAWTPVWTERHGELLGRLQAHARSWTPPGPRRPTWLDVDVCDRVHEAFPGDPEMARATQETYERTLSLLGPAGDDVGTIHADLHPFNMLADDDGTLTAIDFDDTVEGPYLHDLAMVLYYAVALGRDRPADRVVPTFMEPFLRGFTRHAPVPIGSAEAVAALLDLRRVNLAIAVRLTVPEERWSPALRETAVRLHEASVRRTPVVSTTLLRPWFPA